MVQRPKHLNAVREDLRFPDYWSIRNALEQVDQDVVAQKSTRDFHEVFL